MLLLFYHQFHCFHFTLNIIFSVEAWNRRLG